MTPNALTRFRQDHRNGVGSCISGSARVEWSASLRYRGLARSRRPARRPCAHLGICRRICRTKLLFRGVVQTRLSEILGSYFAILLTATLFLMIHVPGRLLLDLPVDAQNQIGYAPL